MRAGDVTRAQHDGLAAKLLKIRCFGAKRYCFGAMPGEPLGHAHQFAVGRLLKGGNACRERGEVNLHLVVLGQWLERGILKRFGVVVRHHELGYTANAMCVWAVPEGEVSALGERLAAEPGVTLCYRRRPMAPHWPYNLFCMIHGKAREEVVELRRSLGERLGLDAFPNELLFSTRRYKQTGARYAPQAPRADTDLLRQAAHG